MKQFANGLTPRPDLQGKRIMPTSIPRGLVRNEEALNRARRKSLEDVGCISRYIDRNTLFDYIINTK